MAWYLLSLREAPVILPLLCWAQLPGNEVSPSRRGVRVVEGARLESVYTAKPRIEGSNPSLSASE